MLTQEKVYIANYCFVIWKYKNARMKNIQIFSKFCKRQRDVKKTWKIRVILASLKYTFRNFKCTVRLRYANVCFRAGTRHLNSSLLLEGEADFPSEPEGGCSTSERAGNFSFSNAERAATSSRRHSTSALSATQALQTIFSFILVI